MEKLRQGLKDRITRDLQGNDLFNLYSVVCIDAIRVRLDIPITIKDVQIRHFISEWFPSVNFV